MRIASIASPLAAEARDGSPLAPNADYRIAVSDFLFRGGDGYTMLGKKGRDVEADGLAVVDLIATWLGQHNPLQLELDGRIAVAK